MDSAPHLSGEIREAGRRGSFWLPGDRVELPAGSFLRGSMWVEWESPVWPSSTTPIVLVHGGGGQGSDWIGTPDGRSGWAADFVRGGRAVYVVDRPGHGRSRSHPDIEGVAGSAMPLGAVAQVFGADDHPRWPTAPDSLQQLAASTGPVLADLAEANERDAEALERLLTRVGPSILIAHSLGSLGTWLVAARRPELVTAIVAIEPAGPPYASIPGLGRLDAGLAVVAPPQVADSVDDDWAVALGGIPIVVVRAPASPFRDSASSTFEYLIAQGLDASLVALESEGILGNGHGLIFESNSREISELILDRLRVLESGVGPGPHDG